jgi:cytochrome c biogenesis protein CcmG/thiol:disulfide interchange protein DsbE
MRRFPVLFVLVFVLILVLVAGCNRGSHPSLVGNPAPDFTVQDADRKVVLRDFRGKVVVLNFWATWCPPCKEEIPALKALQAAHKDKLVVVGVSVFSSETATDLFEAEYKITYPMIFGSYELMEKYGRVRTIPSTFLIDKNGVIAADVIGSRTQAEYEAMLKPLLQ